MEQHDKRGEDASIMGGDKNWLGYRPEESTMFWTGIIGGLILATVILAPTAAGVYRLLLWAGVI